MNIWALEPRDPLVFRDGRAFDPIPGIRAVSLDFPFPSTMAGAVRTRQGQDGSGRFRKEAIEEVLKTKVVGPLLVELSDHTGEIVRYLAPAPSDALLLEGGERDLARHVSTKALVPLPKGTETSTDLPDGINLVGLKSPDPRKPSADQPRFWYWDKFEEWLVQPHERTVPCGDLGHSGPIREARFHVGIDPRTGAADKEKGALFQTQGLEFALPRQKQISRPTKLGLAIATDAEGIEPGLGYLGGERRLVSWKKSDCGLPPCSESLKEKIIAGRKCRAVLLTPAYFEEGWKPTWLLAGQQGVSVRLQAAAVGRPVVASGWDFDKRAPKPARRLAPAGSVYFVSLDGTPDAIAGWVDNTWMQPLSDGEQDRRDGFGLCVLGAWHDTLGDGGERGA